ncbi:MAG: hypothetical protein KAT11_04675 [Phycisphaerae bacterium]|nr:hypothetical protein [Phycisphaerae bacterium]
MIKKLTCLSVLLTLSFAPCTIAAAEQEQWLGYRSSAGAARIVGKTPGQNLELTSERPQGVSLPQLAAEDPLFGKWKTPMVPAGFVWLVLDRSGKTGSYHRLFMDTNANGSLADEKAVQSGYSAEPMSSFRQVKLLLPGEDGPTAYHLNMELKSSKDKTKYLLVTAGGWYEGEVEIEGVKQQVIVFDANANGAFDDAYLDFSRSDRIKIITTDYKQIIGRIGKYIQLGGKLHGLRVARDGSCVQFWPAKDVAMGSVRVPEGLTALGAGGVNGLFFVPVKDGQVKLPLGKYRLNHWEIQRKDKSGALWKLSASGPSKAITFEAGKKDQPPLEFGEPLLDDGAYSKRGSTYRFSNPVLKGRHGERITVTRDGRRPPAPKLLIRNADGSYNRRFTFAYG